MDHQHGHQRGCRELLAVPGRPGALPYVLFAPDVRMDYNGWNTGINVANTVDDENNVNIQFFGNNGNAPQGQARGSKSTA